MTENELNSWFTEYEEENKHNPEFILEELLYDLTEQICNEMESRNIKKSDLARLIGKAPSSITRVLRGSHNLTLKTAVEIATALERRLEIRWQPLDQTITADITMQFERNKQNTKPLVFKDVNKYKTNVCYLPEATNSENPQDKAA